VLPGHPAPALCLLLKGDCQSVQVDFGRDHSPDDRSASRRVSWTSLQLDSQFWLTHMKLDGDGGSIAFTVAAGDAQLSIPELEGHV